MKHLIALIAVLGLGPAAFAAEAKKSSSEFTPDAEVRVEWENLTNYNSNLTPKFQEEASMHMWQQRTKFGGTFRNSEKFSARVSMIGASTWGDETSLPYDDVNAGTSNQNLFLINEAFVTWNMSDDLMWQIGRFPIQIGNGLVVDINDAEQVPYSHEGWHLGYDIEKAHFDIYATNPDNGATAGTLEQALYIFNVDLKGLPEVAKNVNIHAIKVATYNHVDDNATAKDEMRYGFTFGGMGGPVDYALTYEMVGGTTGKGTGKSDLAESMAHVEAGFNMPNVMEMRVGFVYHMDSGEKASTTGKTELYEPLLWNSDKYAGSTDLVSFGESVTGMGSGLTQTGLNFSIMPMEKFEVAVSYDMFKLTEKVESDTAKDALGNEINVELTKKYEGGAQVKFRVGSFNPGEAFGSDMKAVTDYWLQTKFNF